MNLVAYIPGMLEEWFRKHVPHMNQRWISSFGVSVRTTIVVPPTSLYA